MGDVFLRPDKCAESGGLVDDIDATISDLRFAMEDYDGNLAEAVPVARVSFDIDGEEHTELYSVGGSGDFAPDDTGRGLVKLRSKVALTKTCKFVMLINSIIESGFPLNKLEEKDMGGVVGVKGHFLREIIVFKGLAKKNDRETTVLLCTKVLGLPGEGKAKGKGKPKATAKVNAALAEDLALIIQGIVTDADGSMSKKEVLSALFKSDDIKAMDAAVRKEALKLAKDDAWLEGRDEWSVEDGVLKM